MNNVSNTVNVLKDAYIDQEYYPTSEESLEIIKADLLKTINPSSDIISCSILDCGAADGAALTYLTEGSKYGIEIAEPLVNKMPENIFLVGSNFLEQTLIDLKVDVIFSNPPFSQQSQWAEKIINEANASLIYLILPRRWKTNKGIQSALKNRKSEAKVIGHFDFKDGIRETNHSVPVDIIRISLMYESNSYFFKFNSPQIDPFTLWFDNNFSISQSMCEKKISKEELAKKEQDKVKKQGLIDSRGIVDTLVTFYNADIDLLMKNYTALGDLDPSLMKEIGVKVDSIREGFKLKIKGLKYKYWKELFSKLSTITNKLTHDSRQIILDKLLDNTSIDFTHSNIHAIAIWTIKNANEYFNYQLIQMYDRMSEKDNIINYKSNHKVFAKDIWKYNNRAYNLSDITNYKLDYRIILTNAGGLDFESKNGLNNSADRILNDLCVIASNLKFDTNKTKKAKDFVWESGTKNLFTFYSYETNKEEPLFECKAFKNSNLHIKFSREFMIAINVEVGRLKKWIHKRNAASEMDYETTDVDKFFDCNVQLTNNSLFLLSNAA